MKRLCENLMIDAAHKLGGDTAVIRKEPHNTTSIYDPVAKKKIWVKTQMHVTGAVVQYPTSTADVNEGKAVHYYVDDNKEHALPSTKERPNPQDWEMVHSKNSGFVIVKNDEVFTLDD
ncbi:hypothetical protein H1R20_g15667, partial [Candolleomyces eurysporus]